MSPWAVAARLGPYELLSPLGAGGMGEVWKARDTRLDRVVAIKRIRITHSDRFDREARAIAALNHPYICTLHDIGPDYLVMEYVDGATLTGPLPAAEARRLAMQIAEALEEAHAHGILHRDLKPANVLVTANGNVKLLDFGLAKLVDGDNDVTMTGAGQIVGTPAYMSPEQAQGQAVDERSDVFSLGAVLYELVSGRRAFDGLASVLRDNPAPLSGPLADVVRRCLAKDPRARFQTVEDVRAALAATEARLQPGPSLAVLPFANMSGDKEQEYFSDGLAEEIIHALVSVPGLKVIARTSAFAFKGQNTDVRHIAETLGVNHVLEGSVRKAGSRIRVTAQLIAAADGTHIWSERYDRDLEDVFALQDEVAAAVATALRVKLASAPSLYVPKPEAHEALLKGRHHLFRQTPESFVLSREYLNTAVRCDPGYAAAHAWLSEYFFALVSGAVIMPAENAAASARAAALRAVELDSTCREAHAVLSALAAEFDHDWVEAERRFALATSGEAVPPEARRMCGFNYLLAAGRPRDAAHQLALARQDDPLNTFIVMQHGVCLHAAGEAEEAAACFRHASELDDRNWLARLNEGFWVLERGQLAEAAAAFELAAAIAPGNELILSCQAAVHTLAGDDTRARDLLAVLESLETSHKARSLFTYYNLIHDVEKAAEWAATSIRRGDSAIVFVTQLAFCRGLRSSAYWPALAKMLNLAGAPA